MITTDYEWFEVYDQVIDDLFTEAANTEEEVEETNDFYDDWDSEVGFNPYLGDYDWDC